MAAVLLVLETIAKNNRQNQIQINWYEQGMKYTKGSLDPKSEQVS